MTSSETVLEAGPIEVDVSAAGRIRLPDLSPVLTWTSSEVVTVSIGRYSVSLTEEGMLLFRESPPQ